MKRGTFTDDEREYLMSLPAVKSVVQGRIFYSDDFRHECMRRYWRGESPTKIFAEAGMPVSLMGYKRIERCIARWKADHPWHKYGSEPVREQCEQESGSGEVSHRVWTESCGYVNVDVDSSRTLRLRHQRRSERRNDRVAVPADAFLGLEYQASLIVEYEARLRELERRIIELESCVRVSHAGTDQDQQLTA